MCRTLQYLPSHQKQLPYFVEEKCWPAGDFFKINHWTRILSISQTKSYLCKEYCVMSKWHKINSNSEATYLGSWFGSPKIPLKGPISRNAIGDYGRSCYPDTKIKGKYVYYLLNHVDNYNLQLKKPLIFLFEYIYWRRYYTFRF